MYQSFFQLTRSPFELSPDPYFLYPTARHNEALANLYHGVESRKGFVVLTGEVGTGKTLLLRCLFDLLDRRQVAFAYIFNPLLTVDDFLQHLIGDFSLPAHFTSKGALLRVLNQFLLERHRRQLTTVLVVDEAQHLSPELLEEIRLLTNLETESRKLLQIVLAGQPELEDNLDSPSLRQLKQRVALRCRLEPLSREETEGYIQRRLQRAATGGAAVSGNGEQGAANATELFPPAVIAAVHRASGGIPRLINTLCENSLVAAFARQSPQVTPEIVAEVAADFRLGSEKKIVPRPQLVTAEAGADERRALLEALLRLARTLQPEAAVRAAAPGRGERNRS